MSARSEAWLDEEMKDFSGVLQQFKKKQKSKAPLWMAGCVVVMVAIGFIAGYDIAYILRVHFLIGCGLALMAGLCRLIRTADIQSIYRQDESTRVSFNAGGSRVRTNMSIGVSLVITYKADSVSANQNRGVEETLLFQKDEQYQQAVELLKRRCPQYAGWVGNV